MGSSSKIPWFSSSMFLHGEFSMLNLVLVGFSEEEIMVDWISNMYAVRSRSWLLSWLEILEDDDVFVLNAIQQAGPVGRRLCSPRRTVRRAIEHFYKCKPPPHIKHVRTEASVSQE